MAGRKRRRKTLISRRAAMAFAVDFTRHLLILAGVAFVTLMTSGVLFWLFERDKNPNIHNIGSGFQWVTRTLLEGASPWSITTGVGTVLNYVVLIAGVGLVATATGAIVSKLVEMIVRRGSGMGQTRLSEHIVICGWNSKGPEILRELHAEEVEDKRPIVILAPLESRPSRDDLTHFLRGNPSNADDLMRAGIDRAGTAIVLADDSNPSAAADDIDAKTLLTTLAVETLNPDCYTCVEVIRSENRQHFERTKADELVVSSELTGALLATSAVTHGISRVVSDLITHPEGNEFYRIAAPSDIVGKLFHEAIDILKRGHDCVAFAIATHDGAYKINPPADTPIREGDHLLVIARSEIADLIG
jgi:voltage-gated potassium channel